MKPRIPNCPLEPVGSLDVGWFRDLLDCVEYATTPHVDNQTIFAGDSGTLRAELPASAAAGTAANYNCVTAIAHGAIKKHQPVHWIVPPEPEQFAEEEDETEMEVAHVAGGTSNTAANGVALDAIADATYGEVLVNGIVKVKVDITDLTHRFVGSRNPPEIPDECYWESAESGTVRLLSVPTECKQQECYIGVGMGESGENLSQEYNGAFKVILKDAENVQVVYGINHDSDFCGQTDLPGCEMIAKTIVPVEIGLNSIYLIASYTSLDGYSVEFGTEQPPADSEEVSYEYINLADVWMPEMEEDEDLTEYLTERCAILQYWQDGDMNFGSYLWI